MRRRSEAALNAPFRQPPPRRCAHPGCPEAGEHRAPAAPDRLDDHIWLCLDHVRAHNQAWDFFAGMDEAAIEELRRADTTWHRPTWKLGGRGNWRRPMGDDFGIFGDSPDPASGARRGRPASEEDKALAQLGLSAPVRLDEIKARYKQLVKQLHPDVNGTAADDVERLKRINQAYSTLKALHA